MKKIIALLILLTFFTGYTQCPAPSNLTLTILNATSAQLAWTENGTANTWETVVVPDFIVGTPLPTGGFIATTNNPFIFTNLTLSGCNVFFVRSVCSATDFSPWVAVGTLACGTDIYNYLATLSNDNFSINNDNNIKVFPNPSSSFFKIVSDTNIDKITIFDTLGKEILTQTKTIMKLT